MCLPKLCEGLTGCWLGFPHSNRTKYFSKGYKICIRYTVFKIEISHSSLTLRLLKKRFFIYQIKYYFSVRVYLYVIGKVQRWLSAVSWCDLLILCRCLLLFPVHLISSLIHLKQSDIKSITPNPYSY